MDGGADRYEREEAFHDETFAEGSRERAGKFYSITEASRRAYRRLLDRFVAGSQVLEYGCGQGSRAFDLAERGVRVVGIDISSVGIEQARREAERRGLQGASFVRMNAERLDFPDHGFDGVCGSAILHHLDLDRALPEITRILKPDGQAIFFEPLGHNPLINFYRSRTPSMRTVDEHPLTVAELATLSRHFREVRWHSYHLVGLLAVPFRQMPGFRLLRAVLDLADRAILSLPFVSRWGWIVVVECRRPNP